MKTKTDLYSVRCITNLHAGAGSSNYGIVDNEVQRDPVDEMPVVHSSSLKGAFLELFESFLDDANPPMKREDINLVFGEDTTAGARSGGPQQGQQTRSSGAGQYFFYPAQLLFYPVRSNVRPFFYATSEALIRKYISGRVDIGGEDGRALASQFTQLLDLHPDPEEPLVFDAAAEKAFIDEYQNKSAKSVSLGASVLPGGIAIGQVALFHDADMTEICKRLPVIARNNLENGLSKNLWYEEVVPRESRFYFFVSRPEGLDLFEEALSRPEINHKVQIGGNASIGYGLCKLERIPV